MTHPINWVEVEKAVQAACPSFVNREERDGEQVFVFLDRHNTEWPLTVKDGGMGDYFRQVPEAIAKFIVDAYNKETHGNMFET